MNSEVRLFRRILKGFEGLRRALQFRKLPSLRVYHFGAINAICKPRARAGVVIRQTFLKSNTPSKSRAEAGVGTRDGLSDINTPRISAEANWY